MIESITSRQNPRIKRAAKLRTARGRKEQNRIVIDGQREIERAIDSGIEIEEFFVSNDAQESILQPLLQKATSAECFELSASVFEKINFGNRNDGVVATARPPRQTLDEFASLTDRTNTTIAVLEGVEKPGNVGAIVRSADAAGIAGIIVCDAETDLYNPNAIRSSLGTIFKMPMMQTTTRHAIDWLASTNTKVLVARLDAATDYSEVSFTGRSAIVLGSEAHGVTPVWQSPDFVGIKLPMCGIADSLNVSATAAVLFYEARRQTLAT